MPAIESIQILLAAVILTLTGLLVFIGVQVILILREAHSAARRLNKEEKPGVSFVNPHGNGKIENRELQKDDDFPSHIASLQERGRRVFIREGRPLA